MELPTGLVDLHAKSCPEFIENGLYVDIQKLPKGPDYEANNTLYVMGCEMYAYNTLGTFQKGRGMGDCGSSASYSWDSRNEKFVLEEARVKIECDGEYTDWPVVYKK